MQYWVDRAKHHAPDAGGEMPMKDERPIPSIKTESLVVYWRRFPQFRFLNSTTQCTRPSSGERFCRLSNTVKKAAAIVDPA